MTEILRVQRTENSDHSQPLPQYETEGSAGMDLRANFPTEMQSEGIILGAGQRALVPTGLRFEIPSGYEVQIRPRSGLALKNGVTMVNSPGTIDSDYRGEVGVILINHGNEPFRITHGERIAQMVFAISSRCEITETTNLSNTSRGEGGFGSTGRK